MGLSRHVSKIVSPERISQIAAFAGIPIVAIIMAVTNIPLEISWEHVPYIIFFGVVVVGLSYYFFVRAINRIGIIRTILIYTTASTFGVIFSWMFLGESTEIANMMSIVLILSGMWFLRHKMARMEVA